MLFKVLITMFQCNFLSFVVLGIFLGYLATYCEKRFVVFARHREGAAGEGMGPLLRAHLGEEAFPSKPGCPGQEAPRREH